MSTTYIFSRVLFKRSLNSVDISLQRGLRYREHLSVVRRAIQKNRIFHKKNNLCGMLQLNPERVFLYLEVFSYAVEYGRRREDGDEHLNVVHDQKRRQEHRGPLSKTSTLDYCWAQRSCFCRPLLTLRTNLASTVEAAPERRRSEDEAASACSGRCRCCCSWRRRWRWWWRVVNLLPV